MIDVQKNKNDDILEIKVIEELTSADFGHLDLVIDKHIKESVNPRLLLVMQEFSGWETASAFWKDLKMDTEYIGKFDRIAIIGDAKWEEWATKLVNPVTSVEIKFFNINEVKQARNWLKK